MDERRPQPYPSGMRVAAFLCLWLGAAGPALAQACDVSGPMGDVFRAATEQGGPAVGWDVKRIEGVGHETDHFARPQLSLRFSLDETGAMAGPDRASVMVSSYSDKDVGQAPPMSAMRVRVRTNGAAAGEWGADEAGAEILLAKALRRAWPRELVVDVVAPDGELAASSTFDLSKREDVQAIAQGMRKACFR